MKFNRLERQVLRYIDDQYPIVWNQADKQEIIAVGERPLPTVELITQRFRKCDSNTLVHALNTLISYQCVAKVYLRSRDDFAEVMTAPGVVHRMPVAKPGGGVDAFQITEFGKAKIEEFWDSRIRRLLSKWAEKLAEEYVPLIIAFLLGFLLSSAFGIDIKKILGR